MTRLAAALALVGLAVSASPTAVSAQGAANAAVNPVTDPSVRSFAFHVDWGPLKLAEVSFVYRETDEGRIELTGFAESVGLGAFVSDFETEQRVVYDKGERTYESIARWKKTKRSRMLVNWDASGDPEVELYETTVKKPKPITPIPDGGLENTVDPAFPVLDTLRRMAEGESCDGTYRVYDGIRRFDIRIASDGEEVLEADRDWTYDGLADRCTMEFTRIGGFRIEPSKNAPKGEIERVIWIAEVQGVPAPVRLSVSWPLGYATGRIDLR